MVPAGRGAHTLSMSRWREAEPDVGRPAALGLALLAAAWVLAGCASDSSTHHPAGPRPGSPQIAPAARLSRRDLPPPAVPGTNRSLALAASARMIARFPVPPGAIRVAAPPPRAAYLSRLRALDGPVDGSLTRTRWWIVPRGYHRLVDWYVAHTPTHRESTQYPSGRTATESVLTWESHGPATAYSPPSKVVTYSRLTRHSTAIRTDVTLAARDDRTAATLVPPTVTRIEITRQAIDGPDASPSTVTVSDQRDLDAVLAAFDRVRGAYRSGGAFGCGSPVGIVYLYAVTFHWPHHTLVVDSGQPLCEIGRRLTRDGVVVHQRLDPDSPLDPVLQAVYDRH